MSARHLTVASRTCPPGHVVNERHAAAQLLLSELLLDGPANTNGRVERRERLGGLLNFYHRQSA